MKQLEVISVDQWDKKYKPITNTLGDNPSWGGVMFETYGDEQELVRRTKNEYVWTYIDGDKGTVLITGYHIVNRIGYFICENPWESENIQVLVMLEKPWEGHLRDLPIEELETIYCENCMKYTMDEMSCRMSEKDNEAICVYCCGCPDCEQIYLVGR